MDGESVIDYIINNNIEGDLVECGVQEGKQELIWIKKLLSYKCNKNIIMFDTFSGLTKPSIYDYTCENAKFNMSYDQVISTWNNNKINNDMNNWCYCSLENVKSKLNSTGYPQQHLKYVVGNVLDTLNDNNNIPEKISVLRLDTDWYDSSKFELIKLFPNVSKGGVVIFDDYYLWNGQRQATDEYFSTSDVKYNYININDQIMAFIK